MIPLKVCEHASELRYNPILLEYRHLLGTKTGTENFWLKISKGKDVSLFRVVIYRLHIQKK